MKMVSDLHKKLSLAVGWGILAGWNTYSAISNLSRYVTEKTIIFQEVLSRAPEINETAYNEAQKAMEGIAQGNFISGLVSAAVAGGCIGGCIYSAFGRKKEDKKDLAGDE